MDSRLSPRAARLVEAARRQVVRLRGDPDLGAAELAGQREGGIDQAPGDALALEPRRHAQLVDVELGRPEVGMTMHHRRKLADHHAVGESTDEVMAGRREIGRKASAIDRMIEHALGHVFEQRNVGVPEPPDLNGHRGAF
jgi:hypothetical protein